MILKGEWGRQWGGRDRDSECHHKREGELLQFTKVVYVAPAPGLRHDGLPPTRLRRFLPVVIVMCAECADPNVVGRYASPTLYFYFMARDDAAGVNLITPGARYRCSSSRPSIAHRRWGMGSSIILALNTRINHA